MSQAPIFYTVNVSKILNDNHIFLSSDNPNVIQNDERPYYVAISLDATYKAFVPIRTNLRHRYGFVTKNENGIKSGLDFTKTLIVEIAKYTSYLNHLRTISNKEYGKISRNSEIIEQKLKSFLLETFIPIKNKNPLDRTMNESRVYDYSSLQYFEDILDKLDLSLEVLE